VPQSGAPLTFLELIKFLEGKEIAKFKLPERLELVESFPVSTFGKVSKKSLVDMISAKLAAERAPKAG
jgi:2,3-dihydroxybenzoate-AMP ligase